MASLNLQQGPQLHRSISPNTPSCGLPLAPPRNSCSRKTVSPARARPYSVAYLYRNMHLRNRRSFSSGLTEHIRRNAHHALRFANLRSLLSVYTPLVDFYNESFLQPQSGRSPIPVGEGERSFEPLEGHSVQPVLMNRDQVPSVFQDA